ncbi:nuclear transport factor 2 family protein [Neobacillus sp. PS3-34]|uniref:nuclear transport factor 2 family protein n=1 Tax=Neobacillus sp. PS3-34 TaxID=3070678 RepID=UPI0027E134A0|nr:nuclear transport factor 2 family protein [Neobacillus sp. PS3-34]WML48976.1 nuclear transport factor 2 family protein [Neobacillus sp. PS3-34]
MENTSMQIILNKFSVMETISKFSYYADHHEWENLRKLFTNQINIDYTSLAGGEPAKLDAETLVKHWEPALSKYKMTQHVITNHIIELQDESTATCKAYFQAFHEHPYKFGDDKWTLGGEYHFSLLKVNDVWEISGITMTAKWGSGNPNLLAEH